MKDAENVQAHVIGIAKNDDQEHKVSDKYFIFCTFVVLICKSISNLRLDADFYKVLKHKIAEKISKTQGPFRA